MQYFGNIIRRRKEISGRNESGRYEIYANFYRENYILKGNLNWSEIISHILLVYIHIVIWTNEYKDRGTFQFWSFPLEVEHVFTTDRSVERGSVMVFEIKYKENSLFFSCAISIIRTEVYLHIIHDLRHSISKL